MVWLVLFNSQDLTCSLVLYFTDLHLFWSRYSYKWCGFRQLLLV